MTAIVIFVSRKGIPLYDRVQREVDEMTRVMRENVTGARVVKALRKEPYEERRFARTPTVWLEVIKFWTL